MSNPFEDIVSEYLVNTKGRLAFPEACGYYGALMCEVKERDVEIASGLSQPVVNNLKHAGEFRGGQVRYPKVAREYETLGREAFLAKYVTGELRERIRLASQAPRERRVPTGFVRKRASGVIGRYKLQARSDFTPFREMTINIFCHTDNRYYYEIVAFDGKEQFPVKGFSGVKGPGSLESTGPYDNGQDCYRAAREEWTPKE